MRQYAKITPEGTKDYLFDECRARMAAQQALTQVFEQYGYANVATPHLEYYDVFRRVSADWLAEQLYSVTDSRGRLLVMRPDSTLPIARIASTRLKEAALPLRLFYHQSVFRRARFYAGHSDETMQSGVELLGAAGMRADLEILSCAAEALQACGASRFRIELGHADIFPCLAENLGADQDALEALTAAIESKNFPALNELLAPYGETAAAKALRALPNLFGGAQVLQKAQSIIRDPAARKALSYLAELYGKLEALGLQEVIDIDLGLVHGQQYYTGLVFRGYMEGSGRMVLSGGRYDGLMAEFGRPAAAVGFALELDPLAEAMLESGKFTPMPQLETLFFGEEGCEAKALAMARTMRESGIHCACAAEESWEEALNFAKLHGIPRIVAVGQEDTKEVLVCDPSESP